MIDFTSSRSMRCNGAERLGRAIRDLPRAGNRYAVHGSSLLCPVASTSLAGGEPTGGVRGSLRQQPPGPCHRRRQSKAACAVFFPPVATRESSATYGLPTDGRAWGDLLNTENQPCCLGARMGLSWMACGTPFLFGPNQLALTMETGRYRGTKSEKEARHRAIIRIPWFWPAAFSQPRVLGTVFIHSGGPWWSATSLAAITAYLPTWPQSLSTDLAAITACLATGLGWGADVRLRPRCYYIGG